MKTLNLDLGARSYPIHIGQGLLDQSGLVANHVGHGRVAIVTNETVAPLYLERCKKLFADHDPLPIILPDGEQYKNLDVLNSIFDQLLQARCDRQTTLVALGGGVIGDMTGFAAACYMRGVPFIQVPTTLLAQVDSSVGGKTGVNHPLGKNMIGAFYQPRCVLIDTDTLNTLADNQLSAGIAEVIKYGLIRDLPFFEWLESNMPAVRERDASVLTEAIYRSCDNKAQVVAEDEREAGTRALLNFGHTFGHAIEAGMGYGKWLHGEAVGAGMIIANDLARRLGWLTPEDCQRAEALVKGAGLPVRGPDSLTTDHMIDLMSVDKKVSAGRIKFVLLKRLGEAVLTGDVPESELRATLDAMRDG